MPSALKRRALIAFLFFYPNFLFAQTFEVLAIDYPPFTSESSPDFGLNFKYLEEYASENLPDTSFIPVFVPPARADTLLVEGAYCLAFFQPQKTQDDYRFHVLSQDVVSLGLIRMQQFGEFEWDDLREFSGKKIAVLRSSINQLLFKKFFEQGAIPFEVENIKQGLKVLKAGRVDFAFGDSSSLDYHNQFWGLEKDQFQFSLTHILQARVGIYYRKDCQERVFGEGFDPSLDTHKSAIIDRP